MESKLSKSKTLTKPKRIEGGVELLSPKSAYKILLQNIDNLDDISKSTKEIIDKHKNIQSPYNGYTILHYAAYDGAMELMDKFYNSYHPNMFIVALDGSTLLHTMIHGLRQQPIKSTNENQDERLHRYLDTLMFLIRAKLDVTIKNKQNRTALMEAQKIRDSGLFNAFPKQREILDTIIMLLDLHTKLLDMDEQVNAQIDTLAKYNTGSPATKNRVKKIVQDVVKTVITTTILPKNTTGTKRKLREMPDVKQESVDSNSVGGEKASQKHASNTKN